MEHGQYSDEAQTLQSRSNERIQKPKEGTWEESDTHCEQREPVLRTTHVNHGTSVRCAIPVMCLNYKVR